MGAIVGIDVGGTFTDLFCVGDDGAHGILKGLGDPLTRDIEAVERDLNLRSISREMAEQTYGVVVSVAGRERYRIDRNSRRSVQTETMGGLP